MNDVILFVINCMDFNIKTNHLLFFQSSLAALGLIENNAPNITAAMLVSPLMGPVMSVTFGAIISDYELVVSSMECFFIAYIQL